MALRMRTLSRLQALQRKVGAAARVRSTEPPASLQDFIAQSPNRDAPHHLKPLTDLFERIRAGEQTNALLSVPPQHGKSETVLHGLVWLMLSQPEKRHAFATYAQAFTRDQVIVANRIADQHGLQRDHSTLDRWGTPQGGGVTWTSRGGPLTGRPVDGLLLVDDLLKDRLEANSPLIRRRAMDWLSSTAFARRHPGASTIVLATRWHPDDPIGQLMRRAGWTVINLPAILPNGEALWPEHRPLDWLQKQRADLIEDDWYALYMGSPRKPGSALFKPAGWYYPEDLPRGPFTVGYGFDAAYTAKATADYTVLLEGRLYEADQRIYITDMLRVQLDVEDLIPALQTRGVRRLTWRRSGTERGLENSLKRAGIRVQALNATTDKKAAASPAAIAWNQKRILLPAEFADEWAFQIEGEVESFTGQGDAQDDIVDALGALHHALMGGGGVTDADTARNIYR